MEVTPWPLPIRVSQPSHAVKHFYGAPFYRAGRVPSQRRPRRPPDCRRLAQWSSLLECGGVTVDFRHYHPALAWLGGAGPGRTNSYLSSTVAPAASS